jgi:hypothetical protein
LELEAVVVTRAVEQMAALAALEACYRKLEALLVAGVWEPLFTVVLETDLAEAPDID